MSCWYLVKSELTKNRSAMISGMMSGSSYSSHMHHWLTRSSRLAEAHQVFHPPRAAKRTPHMSEECWHVYHLTHCNSLWRPNMHSIHHLTHLVEVESMGLARRHFFSLLAPLCFGEFTFWLFLDFLRVGSRLNQSSDKQRLLPTALHEHQKVTSQG